MFSVNGVFIPQATRLMMCVHVLCIPASPLPPDIDREMQSSHLITADPEDVDEDVLPGQSRQSSTNTPDQSH